MFLGHVAPRNIRAYVPQPTEEYIRTYVPRSKTEEYMRAYVSRSKPRNISDLTFLGPKPRNIFDFTFLNPKPRNIYKLTFLSQPRNMYIGELMNITDEHKIFLKKIAYFVCLPGWGASKTRHIKNAPHT
jgi:hypothetical protein